MSDGESSSDGEPMLSSPDPSDDENDRGDDVFKFTARKFQRTSETDAPTPTVKRRGHHTGRDKVEERLNLIERKEKARLDKIRGRNQNRAGDISSDEDEDKNKKSSCSDVIEIIDHPPVKETTIALDSDDDSDDDDAKLSYNNLNHASKDVLEALKRSQMATNRLKQAQAYHAEDVHVPVEEIDIDAITRKRPAAAQPATLPKPTNLGKALHLTCRCQLKVNGNKQPTQEKTLSIYQNQTLALLKGKIIAAYSLPLTARVTITFDGMSLDESRTAVSYGIEDEDMIDVTASVIAMPQAGTTTAPPSGPKLNLILRARVGKNVKETALTLGGNDILQSLLDNYRKKEKFQGKCFFSFDGETMDLKRTPVSYDMDDGDLIDVVEVK